ncbi:MAG: hypothetical protein HY017_18470 [Betaproteobacteria bacterium]|nr:hypothetical protein [Betaproteobacteria bacterium]
MNAWIPYGCYWSTPFAKWQGSFANLHAIKFAAHVTKAEIGRRGIDPAIIDYGVLGYSVPQVACFYGLPWLTGMIGAHRAGGPSINQACAWPDSDNRASNSPTCPRRRCPPRNRP